MKHLIMFFIIFIFLNCNSYEWIEIGDFNEPTWKYFTDANSEYQIVGVEEGLYLNIGMDWEYCYRGFRVFDMVELDSIKVLVADADGACMSAGLWRFDIETTQYSIVFWAWHGVKILYCNQNYYYIAGNYWQSFDGYNWNLYNYWNADFVYSVEAYENHVVVATENNVYISEDEGITFVPAEPALANIADLVFSCDGVLYGRTPYSFEESIIWVSYDFGVTWSELFYSTYIGRIGVDFAGRLFVGWRGYPEDYSGIAYWDEQAQELVYLNDNLPNLEINRIQPYEHEGTPSVICCTQEGVFYLTDYVSTSDNENDQNGNIYLTNYPNPFNPETTISFNLTAENAELVIYNLKGQKVKTLVSDQLSAGKHSVVWDGRDSNGKRVGSGIYFYKLKAGDFQKVKKMVLLK